VGDLARRPSLTDPLRAAAMRAPRVGTEGWAPLVEQKDKKEKKDDCC
jgi:hypothetical protein